ncbi:unnamed protein product [Adineta steineri]|uniref:Uncharacterized protein n=1 Tax=Adineta steineri TaxID=433720 RepID=A0A814G7J4_9BILA|nr:unnamed protein product [Adineta steineri]CAF0990244.1 unnamed protein product [Adineta steineri]
MPSTRPQRKQSASRTQAKKQKECQTKEQLNQNTVQDKTLAQASERSISSNDANYNPKVNKKAKEKSQKMATILQQDSDTHDDEALSSRLVSSRSKQKETTHTNFHQYQDDQEDDSGSDTAEPGQYEIIHDDALQNYESDVQDETHEINPAPSQPATQTQVQHQQITHAPTMIHDNNNGLYDDEDNDTSVQTEPDITDPFQFDFTHYQVVRILRPPTIFVNNNTTQQKQ